MVRRALLKFSLFHIASQSFPMFAAWLLDKSFMACPPTFIDLYLTTVVIKSYGQIYWKFTFLKYTIYIYIHIHTHTHIKYGLFYLRPWCAFSWHPQFPSCTQLPLWSRLPDPHTHPYVVQGQVCCCWRSRHGSSTSRCWPQPSTMTSWSLTWVSWLTLSKGCWWVHPWSAVPAHIQHSWQSPLSDTCVHHTSIRHSLPEWYIQNLIWDSPLQTWVGQRSMQASAWIHNLLLNKRKQSLGVFRVYSSPISTSSTQWNRAGVMPLESSPSCPWLAWAMTTSGVG